MTDLVNYGVKVWSLGGQTVLPTSSRGSFNRQKTPVYASIISRCNFKGDGIMREID